MSETQETKLTNKYAEEFYDTYLQQLPEDYKNLRWFSSPERRLDYDQTRSVITRAMRGGMVDRLLEVGPGDGVWTDIFIPHAKELVLLDQSEEMIKRAEKRFANNDAISFVHSDVAAYTAERQFGAICAIRCFEYFEDKPAAINSFYKILEKNGTLVIVTKNPDHIRTKDVQTRNLHSDQIDRETMKQLLTNAGFEVTSVMSAVARIKTKYAVMRVLSRLVHKLHVITGGVVTIPRLNHLFTESYIYVAKKR